LAQKHQTTELQKKLYRHFLFRKKEDTGVVAVLQLQVLLLESGGVSIAAT